MSGYRRPPVPAAFRVEHRLRIRHRNAGGGWGGWGRVSRSGGTCSCGAVFGLDADDHTMNAADVRDEYADHVVEAYEASRAAGESA